MAIHEECGVFGILSRKRERLGKLVYYGSSFQCPLECHGHSKPNKKAQLSLPRRR